MILAVLGAHRIGLLHCNEATRARSLVGLGCAKTQTCCGAVEWRSQASDVLSFSREARHSAQPLQRRRNLENCAVPTLVVRGSGLAFHAIMCRAEDDLDAFWNRILTIFAPYTFSHSQGQWRLSAPNFCDLKTLSAVPHLPAMLVICCGMAPECQ